VAQALSAALEVEGTLAITPFATEVRQPSAIAIEHQVPVEPAPSEALIIDFAEPESSAATEPSMVNHAAQPALVNPDIVEWCIPLSEADPCGPDLDLAGDVNYLNFFAQTEGTLPSSFFSPDDGKPFDRSSLDLRRLVNAIKPLWQQSRDLRLLVMRARLLILDRDLPGFANTIAAISEWQDKFWDDVHPRGSGGDFGARTASLRALDLPTVVFPLQYAPLCEGRRIGAVTYRAWMIAIGEVKPRPGEQKHPPAALTEAIADAAPDALATTRRHLALLKTSLRRLGENFLTQGSSLGLENLPGLVEKIQAFVDPHALRDNHTDQLSESNQIAAERTAGAAVGEPPGSLAQAQQALAAIAAYYSRSEPSSPTLPLVRQAHQLIGKSFFEVMSILVPTQIDKAAFQIGAEQFFELPLGKLSKVPEAPALPDGQARPSDGDASAPYRIESRAQAIALLEQVQRFFRHAEPSSPVPMLCDRARALAERDFMGVLREVLPKAALKNFGAEK